MGAVLIIDQVNYNNKALVQDKVFNVDIYACNYPVIDTFGSVSVRQGEKWITATAGFLTLLGCDIQNNNRPIYPFIALHDSQVLEIDYIVSDTEAVLKAPCSYADTTAEGYPINTLTPAPETVIKATAITTFEIVVNTKYGPGAPFVLQGESQLYLGSEPVIVNLSSVFDLILINYYQ